MNIVSALPRADKLRCDRFRNRSVAILVSDGVDLADLSAIERRLSVAGASSTIIAPRIGMVVTNIGISIRGDHEFRNAPSLIFDAVYIPGGEQSAATLCRNCDARHFLDEVFFRYKTIGAHAEGCDLFWAARSGRSYRAAEGRKTGVVLDRSVDCRSVISAFLEAMSTKRHTGRDVTTRPSGDTEKVVINMLA